MSAVCGECGEGMWFNPRKRHFQHYFDTNDHEATILSASRARRSDEPPDAEKPQAV